MRLKIVLVIVLDFLVQRIFSARILAVVPTPSYSHQIVFQPLWKELSLRGHQVTLLTTDPMNDPSLTNLTEIDLHQSYDMWNKINAKEIAQLGLLQLSELTITLANAIFDEQLKHPKVQALIRNESQDFDLLILEGLWSAGAAFSQRFNCPFIEISSSDAPCHRYSALGNPTHPVLNPDFMLPYLEELTFQERLTSVFFSLFITYYHNTRAIVSQDLLVKKHFGDHYPHLTSVLNNVSMLFVNTNPVLHQIRPLTPNVVQIGGGNHLKPPQKLPNDLQKVLDDATEGFIYFSLGNNVKSQHFSKAIFGIFLETFAELPYKVLWKLELDVLTEKPKNVVVSKWFPQQDVLRHPNIKLFITQGGLQSLEEALYSHVPMIGIPFVSDQPVNVKRMTAKGMGLSIDYKTMDKRSLKKVIVEVISNSKYRNKVKELAKLARDQTMTGLERAVWWTEYVIRHKGAKHLKSPAADLPLYQYLLLDVIVFYLVLVLVVVYVCLKLLIIITKRFLRQKLKVKTQ